MARYIKLIFRGPRCWYPVIYKETEIGVAGSDVLNFKIITTSPARCRSKEQAAFWGNTRRRMEEVILMEGVWEPTDIPHTYPMHPKKEDGDPKS